MKTLQEYILESLNDDILNEGKIWDAIKKWWNNLFEPSNNKKFNRYINKFDTQTQNDYEYTLKTGFNINNIVLHKVDASSFKKIVRPNGEEPNKIDNIGFWKFTDTILNNGGDTKMYAFIYKDSNITDTAALLAIKDNEYAMIQNFQIINYFENILSLNDLITLIFKDFYDEIISGTSGLCIYSQTDKDLYEKLLNDCDFKKSTLNGKKCAIKESI